MEGLNLFALSVWDMGKLQRVTRGLRRLFHVWLCFAAIDRAYGSVLQDLFANGSQSTYLLPAPGPYKSSINGLFIVFFIVPSRELSNRCHCRRSRR
jgi:hypothetical protein